MCDYPQLHQHTSVQCSQESFKSQRVPTRTSVYTRSLLKRRFGRWLQKEPMIIKIRKMTRNESDTNVETTYPECTATEAGCLHQSWTSKLTICPSHNLVMFFSQLFSHSRLAGDILPHGTSRIQEGNHCSSFTSPLHQRKSFY